MSGDLDVIVDTDAAHPPFGELVRFARKGLQRRTIDLFEQLPARYAEPPDRALFVEMRHQLTDRRVDLRQAVKVRWRNRPRSHLSTMSTACSTFALSLGRLGLAGKMAVS